MSLPPAFYKYRPEADPTTGHEIRIDHTHAEIHEGEAYTISLVTTMTAASTLNCQITTPDSDKRVHLVLDCGVSGNGATITLFEGATSTSGTPITPVNRNRNSSNTSVCSFVHTPTISADGTQIYQVHVAASNFQAATHETDEFILKKNTKYVIRILIDSGTNAVFSGRAEWYEEDKGGGD